MLQEERWNDVMRSMVRDHQAHRPNDMFSHKSLVYGMVRSGE
jgi:hypothetical protein